MTTPDSRKRYSQPAADILSPTSDAFNVNGSIEITPITSKTQPTHKEQLEARWDLEDGKLICKWIVVKQSVVLNQ